MCLKTSSSSPALRGTSLDFLTGPSATPFISRPGSGLLRSASASVLTNQALTLPLDVGVRRHSADVVLSPPSPTRAKAGSLLARRSSCLAALLPLPLCEPSSPKSDISNSSRRVSFSGSDVEVIEGFTPYGKVYGHDPSRFYFDNEGNMMLCTSTPDAKAKMVNDRIDSVQVGDELECVAVTDIGYRKRPNIKCAYTTGSYVTIGDRVQVTQRYGEWFRAQGGWLPLRVEGKPAFEQLGFSPKRLVGKPRHKVMVIG